jgi:hypothetical protein
MLITHGARQLREWLDAQGKNQEWLAAELTKARDGQRLYQSSVSSWLRGSQIPLWAALAIEKLAGIPATAWTQTESGTDVNAAAQRAS